MMGFESKASVSYDLAKTLCDHGFPKDSDDIDYGYIVRKCYSARDESPLYLPGTLIYLVDGGFCPSDYILAPSPHEVLDWLISEKGLYISIDPYPGSLIGVSENLWVPSLYWLQPDTKYIPGEPEYYGSYHEALMGGIKEIIKSGLI